MKASKMRDMSKEDLLHGRVANSASSSSSCAFRRRPGQLESAPRMRGVRRDIARIQTVLRELELVRQGQK